MVMSYANEWMFLTSELTEMSTKLRLGPKPFQLLNCWFQDLRFSAFVEYPIGILSVSKKSHIE